MKTIKLENLFKKTEELVKKILTNRFLLYKTIATMIAVIIVVAGGIFWYVNRNAEEVEASWYDDNWTKRVKINIDYSKVDADLTDFPVLISTSSLELYNNAQADGGDVIFTDINGNKLERKIVEYVLPDDGMTWRKYNNNAPAVSNTISTDGRIPMGSTGGDTVQSTPVAVIKDDDGSYKMWYYGNTADSYSARTYMATSTDGLTWNKVDNSIPSDSNTTGTNGRIPQGSSGGDSAGTYGGPVIKEDGVYKMWYYAYGCTASMGFMATSSDGLTWNKVNNACETSNTTGTDGRIPYGSSSGDDTGAHPLSVIKDGDVYKMWYGGKPGATWYAFMATSSDGLTWHKVDNSTLAASNTTGTNGRIPLGVGGSGDDVRMDNISVVKEGNTFKAFYMGVDTGSTGRIFLATSTDGGYTWAKVNNTSATASDTGGTSDGRLGLGVSGDDASLFAGFTVIKDDDIYKMWHSGRSGSNVRAYYAYSSPVNNVKMTAWVKVPNVYQSAPTTIYMYYDNPHANETNSNDVWESDTVLNLGFDGGDVSKSGHAVTFNGGAALYATSTLVGIGDGAVYFDGSNDYLSIPNSDNWAFGTGDFTIDFWINLPVNPDQYDRVMNYRSDPAHVKGWQIWLDNDNTNDDISINIGTGAGSSTYKWEGLTMPLNEWMHFAFVRNGTALTMYQDGVAGAEKTSSDNTAGDASYTLEIGRVPNSGGASYLTGYLDEIRISKGIARWTAAFTPPSSPHSADEYDVLLMHMDGDVSVNEHTGAMAGDADWITNSGKIGGALNLDGTGDYIEIVDHSSLDVTTAVTIEAWVNLEGSDGTVYVIASKHDSGDKSGYVLFRHSDNKYYWQAGDGSNWADLSVTSTNTYTDGGWHYIVATYNGVNGNLYIDGAVAATPDAASTIDVNTQNLFVSYNADTPGNSWNGKIDKVSISNVAFSAEEISTNYNNQNSPTTFVTWRSGTGLVGYWKFDEGYASTTYDGSQERNDGTLMDNTLWTMDGKFSRALDFDGTNDYVDVGDIDANSSTVTLWVYADNDSKDIIDFDGGTHSVEISSGTVTATGWTSPTIYVDGRVNSTITTSDWHHIAVTTATEFDVTNLQIGTETSYFEGKIDEVKIYNYPRTAEEVKRDYLSGGGVSSPATSMGSKRSSRSTWDDGGFGGAAPDAYWKFETQSGSTVYDSSDNSYDGTITNATWRSLGKVGGALNFDGSGDFVNLNMNTYLAGRSAFTVEAWYYPKTIVNDALFWNWDGDGTSGLVITIDGESDLTYWLDLTGGQVTVQSGTIIPTLNKWNHVALTYDGSSIILYADGVNVSTVAGSGNVDSNTTAFYIGASAADSSRDSSGLMDEVKIYDYARSAAQIAFDYNGGGPVAYWAFNEGYASTTYDGSGGGNTGTLTNSPEWTLDGKINRALSFSGLSDYITVPDSASLDFITEMSFSMWVKWNSFSSPATINWPFCKGKYPDGGVGSLSYCFRVDDPGTYYWMVNDDGADDGITRTGATDLDIDKWYHMAGTFTASADIHNYLNGVLDDGGVSGDVTSIYNTSEPLLIGTWDHQTLGLGALSRYLNGYIDDLKFYGYARTANQIKEDYSSNGGAKKAAVRMGSKRNSASTWDDGGFGGVAPIGQWRFEEGAGTTAYDSSDNVNDGTFSGDPQWATLGKVGGALDFDGTGDYVITGANPVSGLDEMSAAMWVKFGVVNVADSGENTVFGLWDNQAYLLFIDGDDTPNDGLRVLVVQDGTKSITWDTVPTIDTWYYVTFTSKRNDYLRLYINGIEVENIAVGDGALASVTDNIFIGWSGNAGHDTFNGKIDEVKIYNYARSAAQIAFDYNGGGPMAHWKFDEKEGSTAYDASGQGNNGTITGDISTMWSDGVSGVVNTALSFDGTGDYISINNVIGQNTFTISAWINPERYGGENTLNGIFYQGTASSDLGTVFGVGNGGSIGANTIGGYYEGGTWGNASDNSIILNEWQHVVISYNAGTASWYVNGESKGTSAGMGSGAPGGDPSYIGFWYDVTDATRFFQGKIDELKVHNYPRTADQIKKDYGSGGASIRF